MRNCADKISLSLLSKPWSVRYIANHFWINFTKLRLLPSQRSIYPQRREIFQRSKMKTRNIISTVYNVIHANFLTRKMQFIFESLKMRCYVLVKRIFFVESNHDMKLNKFNMSSNCKIRIRLQIVLWILLRQNELFLAWLDARKKNYLLVICIKNLFRVCKLFEFEV